MYVFMIQKLPWKNPAAWQLLRLTTKTPWFSVLLSNTEYLNT